MILDIKKLFEKKPPLIMLLRPGIAPARLHRENIPMRNPNFTGNDPTAYQPTEKSLVEVLLR